MTETKKQTSVYLAINKGYFCENDKLTFDIYVSQHGKKCLYRKSKQILSREDVKDIGNFEKLYTTVSNAQEYKLFIQDKSLSDKYNIDKVTDEIKELLKDIFSDTFNTNQIKKLHSLINSLTNIIIDNNLNIKALLDLISDDYATYSHSLNVAIYATALGRYLKFQQDDLLDLTTSAILLDIGKSTIDEKLLYKESALSEAEYKVIKTHPTQGVMLARRAGITNTNILSGIHHHHERLDGSGYPNGLKDRQISLFARIIAICDTFDAMSTNRSFQDSKKSFDTLLDMKKNSKGKLDSALIISFIKLFSK